MSEDSSDTTAAASSPTPTRVGAFGGNLTANIVTNSYYNSGATAQLAAGRYGSAAADYVGIDPVAGADMTKQASFPAFAFAETWLIDEGESMPYLKCFTSFTVDSFARWLKYKAGLPAGTRPEEMVNGIPAVARYLFDILPDSTTNDDGDPVLRIHIAADGSPWLSFPAFKYPNELGARFFIVSSPEVDVWTGANVVVSDPIDMSEGVYDPGYDPVPEKMFFKYKIVIDD